MPTATQPGAAVESWEDRAACAGQPYEIFFGLVDKYGQDYHPPDLLAQARQICSRCPVREECLNKALTVGPDACGVWGGTTKTERECLDRRIVRAKCPVCQQQTLLNVTGMQVCGSCGQSWPTARTRTVGPGQPV